MLWGRVLAALDSPVVRGVGRVVLCSQVQNPLGPQGHMRMPFERSDEASCFLQADLIAKQLSLEQYRHTGEESWGEECDFVDERDLQNWKGGVVSMTCQHFPYGVDQLCQTMMSRKLRQQQLQQREHLKKRCKLWSPTW